MKMDNLTFLKLGGSLITVKSEYRTQRPDMLARIAGEIAGWLADQENARLLIGHGSGSFGHIPAKTHGTRSGVRTPEQWAGFVEVWRAAAELNQLVMSAFLEAGVQAIGFPPSAGAVSEEGRIAAWDVTPIRSALEAGLVPVVYGDVAFDRAIGGTILSTEALFSHLATDLPPHRILIAGIEGGVWVDYPQRNELIPVIDPRSAGDRWAEIHEAEDPDVTGGMREKVAALLALVERLPGLQVRIFGGLDPGSVAKALSGAPLGTLLANR